MCHSRYLLKHTRSTNNQWNSLLNDLLHTLRPGHSDNICLSHSEEFLSDWFGYGVSQSILGSSISSDATCSPPVPPVAVWLLHCCISHFYPVVLGRHFPNQGTNALGIAFMPWLFFPLQNFLRGAALATERIWPSGTGAWQFLPSKAEIYDPVTWTFPFQVFLVSNWFTEKHIDVKCSRKSVCVISNDRILFSSIHLQLFCLSACLRIYSVGFFSLREA